MMDKPATGPAIRPWDIRQILEVLPHRYPMLLLDRVLELVPGRRIVAIKNVTINEPMLEGHFPGHPVVPGVLLLEGLAQAGAFLLLHDMEPAVRRRKLLYFTAIERARFRRPVVPGDQLRYEIKVLRLRLGTCRLEAVARVGEQVAAEGILSSAMVER